MKIKRIISASIMFILGTFLLALTYNVFLVSNELVFGGVSGLAIIIKSLFKIDPWLFVLIANIILLILSLLLLGKKKTLKTSIGSIIYPIFINITAQYCNIVTLNDDNTLIMLVLACFLYGLATAIIYKSGFTTGGSDILIQILSKYCNISLGKSNTIVNIIIIGAGAFVFGIEKLIYAILAIVFCEKLTDKMIIGVSKTKTIMYRSDKHDEINDYIKKTLNIGVTKIIGHNALLDTDQKHYLIVVSNKKIQFIKHLILNIDPKALIIINDCYESLNGQIDYKNIDYIS